MLPWKQLCFGSQGLWVRSLGKGSLPIPGHWYTKGWRIHVCGCVLDQMVSEDTQEQAENRSVGLDIGFGGQRAELGHELLLLTQTTDLPATTEKWPH